MEKSQKRTRGPRKIRAIDDEIAAAEVALAQLRSQKKEKDRKDIERNKDAISAVLMSEGLFKISVETWINAMPQLLELLKADSEQMPETDKPVKRTRRRRNQLGVLESAPDVVESA